MNEDELLAKFGLVPNPEKLPHLRDLLRQEIANPNRYETGNEYMKTLCVLLFAGRQVEDATLIYEAKHSSFDAACYIDIELICGAGLKATLNYLAGVTSPLAKHAMDALRSWEDSGEAEDFTVEKHLEFYRNYYGLNE